MLIYFLLADAYELSCANGYITVLNCVCCVVYTAYDPVCSVITYCPAWQMLGLLLIVLCSGLSAIVIKTLLLLLLLILL